MTKIRDDDYLRALGTHLRKLREGRGLSQYKLADLANVNRSQIIDIESGKINTTVSTIKALAEALEINPKDLLDF